jgi:hypothetical protein
LIQSITLADPLQAFVDRLGIGSAEIGCAAVALAIAANQRRKVLFRKGMKTA